MSNIRLPFTGYQSTNKSCTRCGSVEGPFTNYNYVSVCAKCTANDSELEREAKHWKGKTLVPFPYIIANAIQIYSSIGGEDLAKITYYNAMFLKVEVKNGVVQKRIIEEIMNVASQEDHSYTISVWITNSNTDTIRTKGKIETMKEWMELY